MKIHLAQWLFLGLFCCMGWSWLDVRTNVPSLQGVQAQVPQGKRLSVHNIRRLQSDAGAAVGDMAGEEINMQKASLRMQYMDAKQNLPGKASNLLFGNPGDTVPKLYELIPDEKMRSAIEDRRNKKRFVQLLGEWWTMPSDVELRLKAEFERLKRFRTQLDTSKYLKKRQINGNDAITYGWHPAAWGLGDEKKINNNYKKYKYNRLSYVSYYSYDIDPYTGTPRNPEVIQSFIEGDFVKTVREQALKQRPINKDKTPDTLAPLTKIILAVSCHGEENTALFLSPSNLYAQRNLIDSVIYLMDTSGVDGIEINFEGVQPQDKRAFENFVKDLAFAVHSFKGDDGVVFLTVPAYDPYDVWDLSKLIQSVDYFLLQGYNFHFAPDGLRKMPTSPLNYNMVDQDYDIRALVDDCVAEVGTYNMYRLILAVSYVGEEWMTKGTTQTYLGPIVYEDIISKLIPEIQALAGSFDSPVANDTIRLESAKNMYVFEWQDTTGVGNGELPSNYQIYYEDTLSLMAKYQFVIDYRLGGIGIWALGYDGRYQHFWEILEDNFMVFVDPADENKQKLQKVSSASQSYGVYALAVLLYWAIFMSCGFVWALFTTQTRQSLFESPRFRFLYICFFIFLLLLLGNYFGMFQYNVVILLAGVSVGSFISWSALKALNKQQVQQP